MKCSLYPIRLLGFAVASVLTLTGQTEPVEIARYSGNRVAAVSYSFDDGTLGHYNVAAPTLEKYGFRGSFGGNAGKVGDTPEEAATLAARIEKGSNPVRRVSWQEWRELSAKGHEVANHGLLHRGLPGLTPEQLEQEVNEAARIITAKVGVRPLSFIYPGNGRNPVVRDFVLKTHIATREREHRFGGQGFNLDVANAIIDKAIKARSAIIIMAHVVAEPGYQPTSAEDLDGHLLYVSKLRDKIWVDTMAQVSRYTRERDAAQLTVKAQGPESVTFELLCPLDPELFTAPLTCILHPGENVVPGSVKAERAGSALSVTESGGTALVDVLPGAGVVTVRWKNTGSTK